MADQPVPIAPIPDDAMPAVAPVTLPDAPVPPGSSTPADPLVGVAEHIRGLVEAFDREIDRQRRKAELEATVVMAEARTEAAQMRLDARAAEESALAEADRLLRAAREDAESLRRDALALRESTLAELRGIRDRMRTSLFELESGLPEDVDGGRVIVLEDSQSGSDSSGPAAG